MDMHMNTTENKWYHMKASLNRIGKASTYITSHSVCSRNNVQYRMSQVHKVHANYQAG